MQAEPFFQRDSGTLRPMPISRGPWNESSLHGRVVIGLLARELERAHGAEDFQPARLTVDMYRLPDLSPVTVETAMVRDGRRIRVADATFVSGGRPAARATCQLLRRSAEPPGRVWSPPPWDAPPPADLPPPDDPRTGLGGMWETRPISGTFGGVGERRLWMREVRELIGGEPLTPWARVALAADFASPFANAGDAGLGWINCDVTLYLARLPESEWIGFEVTDHRSSAGVAIGACRLHDEAGPIGSATVCALAQSRLMSMPAAEEA